MVRAHQKISFEKPPSGPYKPSSSYVLGIRIFEALSSIAIVISLAITAAYHNILYNNGINYDGSKFGSSNDSGFDHDGVMPWIIYGLVISVTSFVTSTIFMLDREVKFSLLQAVTSIIFCAGYVAYIVVGALNTPTWLDCSSIDSSSGADADLIGAMSNRCSAPKAAEFFAFVATFAYCFSASTAIRVFLDSKFGPKVEAKEKTKEDIETRELVLPWYAFCLGLSSHNKPSHKTFRIKRVLGKKQKQNRPIPQWIRLRTGNTI
ncbi:13437_t:CDS:2, partial [Dentiscutata erythropus]